MRLPFELAEPGTDPTRQHNPYPKRRWTDALPWIAALLALFLLWGYRHSHGQTASARRPRSTPTPVAAAVTVSPQSPMAMSVGGAGRGFFAVTPFITPPTQTPWPTPTPVATSTPVPTSTPTPVGMVRYAVFVNGQQVVCECVPGAVVSTESACQSAVPVECDVH